MADKDGKRRPRRRCVANKSSMPSAIHYVGYVEEDETPEMIMKKFEEMEKVMAATGPSDMEADEASAEAVDPTEAEDDAGLLASTSGRDAEAGLTDKQLMEIFKQTSIFNVRSALANNDALMANPQAGDQEERAWDDVELSSDDELWAEMREFWSDEEDNGEGNKAHWKRLRKGEKQRRAPRAPGLPRASGQGRAARHNIITHYNAVTQALIRRKVKMEDPDAIYRILVPQPLPLSWGRTVKPYQPRTAAPRTIDTNLGNAASSAQPAAEQREQQQHGSNSSSKENKDVNGVTEKGQEGVVESAESVYIQEEEVAMADYKSMRRDYQGILINKGWEHCSAEGDGVVATLAKLPIPRLSPVGFVFIWISKEHIAAVVKLMYRWGYIYVENLTWVQMAPNNTIITAPAPYAQRSHLTLFIFRKSGEGKDIELRHQRNPDVLFDCVRKQEGQVTGVPEEAFVAIETLLPTGKGRFLELWAPVGLRRPGWTHVAQKAD